MRYAKWVAIVGLNSVLGFLLGGKPEDVNFQIGIVLGIATWLIAYMALDNFLIRSGRHKQSKRLVLCASLRIPLQLLMWPDIYAGILAGNTLSLVGLTYFEYSLVEAYAYTILTGLYLSVLCSMIYLLLAVIDSLGIQRTSKIPDSISS